MVWLTYRQHRLELGAALIGAVAVALAVIATALYVASVRIDVGLDSCPVVFGTPECHAKLDEYMRRTGQLRGFALALYVYPVIVAAFLAGPIIARDFERGTHRLVWTQGITRTRWISTKLGIVVGVALLSALIVGAVGDRARDPLGRTDQWSVFDFSAPALVSYLVFAVALGAALGALLRRSLPAMFASLVLFVGARILVEYKLRPNFLPQLTAPSGGPDFTPVPADALQLGVRFVYSSGADFPQEQFNTLLRNFRGADLYSYLRSNDVLGLSFYQPADRFWLFQSIEAAIFLGLSLLLVLATIWLVRRHA
jgi:hypothetical protein